MIRTIESTETLGASRSGAPIEERTTDRPVPSADEVREIVEGPRRPIRWMRWLAALVVIAAGVGIVTYLVLDNEPETAPATLDDGSFEVNEVARLEALAPVEDGSFEVNEVARLQALAPLDDGSFQVNETARMEALDPSR